jgi:mannose-6-phosphate isomerase
VKSSRHWCRIVDVMYIERDERPWGAYEVLAEGEGYKVKRIEVNPGHRLSLQMHQSRSEHWVIVSGEAIVTLDDLEIRLRANQEALVPPRTKHRVANPGTSPLLFIEVQCGDYLGEDDITRFEDDYNRTGRSDGE